MVEEMSLLIEAVAKADTADKLLEAVKSLAATGEETAIPTLIEVLGYNNPGAAVAAVDGLIAMGEVVVPYLQEQLDYYNYGARAWAIRVFAGIGDPIALPLLIKAASSDFSLSVRRAAAKGLGSILWHKLADREVFNAQKEVLNTLVMVVQDGEWVVRYSGVVGLACLYKNIHEDLRPTITTCLHTLLTHEPESVVRARIRLALTSFEQ